MNIVRACVRYPVTTMVGVILAVLFGAISLFRIPVQMIPTVDRPVISVRTNYDGAAPLEVEEEITRRLEERLTSVEGMVEMNSDSREGRSSITLEFDWGTNKDIARLDVAEKLGRVRNIPDDADRPLIRAVNSDERQPIAWFTLVTNRKINEIRTEMFDVVLPKLERVPGVGDVRMWGGEAREVRVTLDYPAMSARGVTVGDLRNALLRENRNTKGGNIDEGKKRYVIRTVGNFTELKDLQSTIVAQREGGPIYLRDIAQVSFDYRDAVRYMRVNQRPTMGIGIIRKTGSNTIEVMNGVKKTVAQVNALYKDRDIHLRQVYNETDYIFNSRSLVINNIYIGGALAVAVLLVFLGSVSSVIVIAIAIPVAIIATFIFIFAFGRSINVISLAGLAFAVGMVVDNAIVVLENIYRHREMGKDRWQAAVDGGSEVWGAILASTLTTLAVFIPVIFVQDEAGQLFRDIAIAISVAVGFSLIVSITVIPMLSARLLSQSNRVSILARIIGFLGVYALGNLLQRLAVWLVRFFIRGVFRRLFFVGGVTAGAVALAWYFFPPIDYLPKGNRNFFFSVLRTSPGLNLERQNQIVQEIEGRLARIPELGRYFAVASTSNSFTGNSFIGMVGKREYEDQKSMRKLNQKLFGSVQGVPGVRAFVAQASLFSRRGGGGISLEVNVTGDDLAEIKRIANEVEAGARQLPEVLFVNSSFELANPEVQIHVDREKAADLGVSVSELGNVIETLVNGTLAGIFRDRGKELDIVLRAPRDRFLRTQSLDDIIIYTPAGQPAPLNQIAEVRHDVGPTRIQHLDRARSVRLTANLKEDTPLQVAIDRMKEKVVNPISANLPLGYGIDVSGQAKALDQTWNSLKWSFLLALLITYLLMAALFESWSYPFIIMFSVPLAATGGVVAVYFMNQLEPSVKMDTLTMLGFIILTGIVVNNAILLVHQALNHHNAGMGMREAILESVQDRMRPIFMTTTTTVFGLLPLVVATGSGSELYRGLGSAILGGLTTSTLITVVLIPVIFSLWADLLGWLRPSKSGPPAFGQGGQGAGVRHPRGRDRRRGERRSRGN
ncbi:MAG: efflux RND transporter permease subunit [Nitrospinota bacterium]|jgi:HAE1 family hydrophobic/amphiphilic exporter-1|nr:efflux RND transporter permease subunit [Nitrospinota bacterium]